MANSGLRAACRRNSTEGPTAARPRKRARTAGRSGGSGDALSSPQLPRGSVPFPPRSARRARRAGEGRTLPAACRGRHAYRAAGILRSAAGRGERTSIGAGQYASRDRCSDIMAVAAHTAMPEPQTSRRAAAVEQPHGADFGGNGDVVPLPVDFSRKFQPIPPPFSAKMDGFARVCMLLQQFPLRGRHSRKARRGSIVAKGPAAATHLAPFGLAPTLP